MGTLIWLLLGGVGVYAFTQMSSSEPTRGPTPAAPPALPAADKDKGAPVGAADAHGCAGSYSWNEEEKACTHLGKPTKNVAGAGAEIHDGHSLSPEMLRNIAVKNATTELRVAPKADAGPLGSATLLRLWNDYLDPKGEGYVSPAAAADKIDAAWKDDDAKGKTNASSDLRFYADGLADMALFPLENGEHSKDLAEVRGGLYALAGKLYDKSRSPAGDYAMTTPDFTRFSDNATAENKEWFLAANDFEAATPKNSESLGSGRDFRLQMMRDWTSSDSGKHVETAIAFKTFGALAEGKVGLAEYVDAANRLAKIERRRAKRLNASAEDLARIDAPVALPAESAVPTGIGATTLPAASVAPTGTGSALL